MQKKKEKKWLELFCSCVAASIQTVSCDWRCRLCANDLKAPTCNVGVFSIIQVVLRSNKLSSSIWIALVFHLSRERLLQFFIFIRTTGRVF